MNRPVLRWFGGKYLLAPWIISMMPKHRIYVEPFGGAGSVLMQKPRAYAEVYNDLDDSVVTLFSVLRDAEQCAKLESALRKTPFARRELELAHSDTYCPIEKSRRLIIRSFMGFGADSASNTTRPTSFRSNSNRSGTTPAHDWANYAPELRNFHERLVGVCIESRDAMEVMSAHDGPDTLHYVDPPYWPKSRRIRSYKHEYMEAQHAELLAFLPTLKGKVMMS